MTESIEMWLYLYLAKTVGNAEGLICLQRKSRQFWDQIWAIKWYKLSLFEKLKIPLNDVINVNAFSLTYISLFSSSDSEVKVKTCSPIRIFRNLTGL